MKLTGCEPAPCPWFFWIVIFLSFQIVFFLSLFSSCALLLPVFSPWAVVTCIIHLSSRRVSRQVSLTNNVNYCRMCASFSLLCYRFLVISNLKKKKVTSLKLFFSLKIWPLGGSIILRSIRSRHFQIRWFCSTESYTRTPISSKISLLFYKCSSIQFNVESIFTSWTDLLFVLLID